MHSLLDYKFRRFHLGIINLVRMPDFRKTNTSYPLIDTRTCAYHGVRNINFSEKFVYVLNEWSPIKYSAAPRGSFALYSSRKSFFFTIDYWWPQKMLINLLRWSLQDAFDLCVTCNPKTVQKRKKINHAGKWVMLYPYHKCAISNSFRHLEKGNSKLNKIFLLEVSNTRASIFLGYDCLSFC